MGTLLRRLAARPWLGAMLVVGALLSPLFWGLEPIGGDPDFLYRPIKWQLSRSLHAGTLPFWSDLYGIGVPLVAESHAAAFYPPNWVLYRFLDVPFAFRLSLWLHTVALAAAVCAYARWLGFSAWGSFAAAVGFALCGFQAVHVVHEPFYTLMPYLPLCLLLGDRFMMSGRWHWLALLALAWGVQLTVSHFQIQMWTGVLVLILGGWRAYTGEAAWKRWRLLAMGLAWAMAVAWPQLGQTWQLTRSAGFRREAQFLSNYLGPPAHWAQWALPAVYLGQPSRSDDLYWSGMGTTSDEATAYCGVTVFILACVGWFGVRRPSALVPWKWIGLLAIVLATMPSWWPSGFRLLLMLPGLGWFRAPGRYSLLTCLSLALLAGRGLDRSIPADRFRKGMTAAIVIGALAWIWSYFWTRSPLYQGSLGPETIALRFASAAVCWVLALAMILLWRKEKLGGWAPAGLAALELCALYFVGTANWGRSAGLPSSSAVLRRLSEEPGVGLVAGRLEGLSTLVGRSAAYSTLGITPPPPNFVLEPALKPPGRLSETDLRWLRRLGVTHGVWSEGDDLTGTTVVARIHDPALRPVFWDSSRLPSSDHWVLVRYPDPFPAARVVAQGTEAVAFETIFNTLSKEDLADRVWFAFGDHTPTPVSGVGHNPIDFIGEHGAYRSYDINLGPPAKTLTLKGWTGREGVVEHDGSCYLIVNIPSYPGWFYRINGSAEEPVLKADAGLLCVPLKGNGPSKVTIAYHPLGLRPAIIISLAAIAAALGVAGYSLASRRNGESTSSQADS